MFWLYHDFCFFFTFFFKKKYLILVYTKRMRKNLTSEYIYQQQMQGPLQKFTMSNIDGAYLKNLKFFGVIILLYNL